MAPAIPDPVMQALLILLFILPLLAFWAWMFTEMRRNPQLPDEAKSNWVMLFILLNVFGAALYYLNIYRDQR